MTIPAEVAKKETHRNKDEIFQMAINRKEIQDEIQRLQEAIENNIHTGFFEAERLIKPQKEFDQLTFQACLVLSAFLSVIPTLLMQYYSMPLWMLFVNWLILLPFVIWREKYKIKKHNAENKLTERDYQNICKYFEQLGYDAFTTNNAGVKTIRIKWGEND